MLESKNQRLYNYDDVHNSNVIANIERDEMMDDISKEFVKEVDNKIKRIGKTQMELSKDIDFDYSTLNRIINSKRKLDFNLAVAIATALDLDLNKFKYMKTPSESKNQIELWNELYDILEKLKIGIDN